MIAIEPGMAAAGAGWYRVALATLALAAVSWHPPSGAGLLPALGQSQEVEPDWDDRAPHPLSFVRIYRSGDMVPAGLGPNWSHNWAASLVSTSLVATVQLGTGGKSVFTRSATTQPWQPHDRQDRLEAVAGDLVYTRSSDESRWRFAPEGRLVAVTQRNGWTATLQYDAAGRLATVVNAFGRILAFTHDGAGRLVAVTPPDPNPITLGYDAQSRLVSVRYPDGATRQYLYENPQSPSAMTGVVDETDVRTTTYGYDSLGRATSVVQAGGTGSSSVTYPPGGATGRLRAGTAVDPAAYRMTLQVTDALGHVRTTIWQGGDGRLRLASISDPASGGGFANRTVDHASLLTVQETDFLGVQTTYQWDVPRRLPTSVTRAAGRPEAQTSSTQWHPSLRLPVLLSEPGRAIATTYDAAGNRLSEKVTDTATGQSRNWTWTYTPKGLPATLTGPLGATWTYGYDTAGHRTSVVDPLGRTTSFVYDAAGRLANRTDPGGLVTSYAYDVRGRVSSVQAGSETTTFTWLSTGRLAAMTLPSGHHVAFGYDSAQRLVSASDNRGTRIDYTLDAAGNRVREEVQGEGGLAGVTQRVLNTLNQVVAVQGALGQSTQIAYDANGRPTTRTDPLNHATQQAYDGLGRATSTALPGNAVATQVWNALDQLAQVQDPKGVATTYTYNAFGEVLSETSPDIGAITYTRDAEGRVIAMQDAKGQITRIARDALGRPTAITYADSAQATFAWDAGGRLEQVQDRSGSTTFRRDVNGRVTGKSISIADDAAFPAQYGVLYGYAQGQLSTIRYPSGLAVTYPRNAAGRITGIQVQHPPAIGEAPKPSVQFVADLAYTGLGQPRSWTWHNGAQAFRTFDSDGRMTGSEFATYVYDAAGRIVGGTQKLLAERTEQQAGGSAVALYTATLPWTAGYDSRDRLTSFRLGGATGAETQYTYDPNSNRLTAIVRSGTESDLERQFEQLGLSTLVTQALAVPATSNRLLGLTQTKKVFQDGQEVGQATEQQAYAVDANGSMTHDGRRDFGYDASGRLVEVKLQQGGERARVKYLHNAFGQRVFKSQAMATQATPQESTLGTGFVDWLRSQFGWLFSTATGGAMLGQAFVYGDGEIPAWALLGEYDNGAGLGRTEYIWLPLENGYAVPVGMVRDGALYAVHPDHLGTPRLVTDPTNRPVWQWPYSAFGQNRPTGVLQTVKHPVTQQEVLKGTAPGAVLNFRFPGQYFDAEAGSFYNVNRDYVPHGGRYMQLDPIGLAGGWNRFAYVEGDPLGSVDPLGLASCIYTISTGEMVCIPKGSEHATFHGKFATGNNSTPGCKNDWTCQGIPDVGPLPEGVYQWTGRGRKSPERRNLTPIQGLQYGRSGFQTHSCMNPFGPSTSQKGACSNGCITGLPDVVRRLNELLDQEPGSVLTVVP